MLIAKQVEKITKASGVAIGIVEGDELVYRATRGTADDEMGSRVPLASCLSAYCLHSGQILQCSDAKRDTRLRYEHCRLRYVQSLIAVPVYQEGKIAGVLEVRFAEPNSVREHDARSSQLMAGLVSDAIARASGLEWKQCVKNVVVEHYRVSDGGHTWPGGGTIDMLGFNTHVIGRAFSSPG